MRRILAVMVGGWLCFATIPSLAKEATPIIPASEADSEIDNLLMHIERILIQQEHGSAADINQDWLAAASMYHYASAKGRGTIKNFPNHLAQRAEQERADKQQQPADNIAYFVQQARPFILQLTGKPAPTDQSVPEHTLAIAPSPSTPQSDPDRDAKALLARGDQMLTLGDLSAARMFYERAAQMGLGAAASRMGDTYDAVFLAQHNLIGPEPDPDKAKEWYAKAESMGTSRTAARLISGER